MYRVFNNQATNSASQRLQKILLEDKPNIVSVNVLSTASSDGEKHITNQKNERGHNDNEVLAENRGNSVYRWFRAEMGKNGVDNIPELNLRNNVTIDVPTQFNVSSLAAKLTRCAILEIGLQPASNLPEEETEWDGEKEQSDKKYNETKIIEDIQYDDEYVYFEHLKESDVFLHNKIVDKVKYFDPAYHSITPEGFNSRLTFLNQCTRQGPTIKNGTSGMGAGNLAFGRAPYCVLRIGDFYNTKICIDSVTISYDNGGGVQ